MGDSDSSTERPMSKAEMANNRKVATKRLMVEGKLKQVAAEYRVNHEEDEESEPTEGFLNVGNAEESEKQQSELKKPDYKNAEEDADEDEEDAEEDPRTRRAARTRRGWRRGFGGSGGNDQARALLLRGRRRGLLASGLAAPSTICACTPRDLLAGPTDTTGKLDRVRRRGPGAGGPRG